MHPKQLRSVLNLPAADQYSYLVRKIVDFEAAYGLYSDGWAMMSDADGKQCFPIWPELEFAELLATGDWEDYAVKPISLEQLCNKWIPGLTSDQINIAAFPIPKQTGVVLRAEKFGADLATKAAQYE